MNLTRRPAPFQNVGAAHPSYSIFNLSNEHKITFDIGQFIPIDLQECIPGDHFRIGYKYLLRTNPLIAPVMHTLTAKVDSWFIPNRLLWPKLTIDPTSSWEDFYTQGADGKFITSIPKWTAPPNASSPTKHTEKYSLWDYYGLPTSVNGAGTEPIDLIRRLYYLVWNVYIRDETLQAPVDIFDLHNYSILNCAYEKDYFTASLPFEQRGEVVGVPLQGYIGTEFVFPTPTTNLANVIPPITPYGAIIASNENPAPSPAVRPGHFSESSNNWSSQQLSNWNGHIKSYFNQNRIDVHQMATFTINELRFAFQLQKYFERRARGGYRYIEQLKAMFGSYPRDERLQRPEYIGGSRNKVYFSEVLQTSETNPDSSPQGNMSGHGMSAPAGFIGRYNVTEFGWILTTIRVVPKNAYQQGISRQYVKDVPEDFYNPLFATIGEQQIRVSEIFATNDPLVNKDAFGYIGRWDELRYKPDVVCGDMRDVYDYWHMGRKFATRPYLNDDFIQCKYENHKRIFAVMDYGQNLLLDFANVVSAARPMPAIGEPSLVDHH